MELQENQKKEPTRITITFPTNAYFMSGIRDFTLSMIKNMTQFSEQWAYRFQTVVDELCNNAIEFGSAAGKEIKIVFLYREGESLEIIVEDSGTGKSQIKAAELQRLVEERKKPGFVFNQIRGRGLPMIVAGWSDELKFEEKEDGGLRVTVKKSLSTQHPLPALSEDRAQAPSSPQPPNVITV